MVKYWQKKSSRTVLETPVFKLRNDVLTSPRTGEDLNAYVLESRNWTNIVPITKDRRVVMVRQYRFGSEDVTLEVPGGLIDGNDESTADASRREMREETGYDSDEIIPLGCVLPNPAILNNKLYIYAAHGAELKHEQELDEGEDVHVELVALDDVPDLIRTGVINHAYVLNAFYLYDLYLKTL